MKIVLATENPGKTEEIRALLKDMDVDIVDLSSFPGLKLPPERGLTFKDNAVEKARYVREFTGMAALADDSGLCVDSLKGRPGVMSARYAGPGAGDRGNYEKLIHELEGKLERAGRFVCVVAFMDAKGDVWTFEGILEGFICGSPRGDNGFGYDPVFTPTQCGRTLAEMSPVEKNKISHRKKALDKFRAWIGQGAAVKG